jgi:hypothetical protein
VVAPRVVQPAELGEDEVDGVAVLVTDDVMLVEQAADLRDRLGLALGRLVGQVSDEPVEPRRVLEHSLGEVQLLGE